MSRIRRAVLVTAATGCVFLGPLGCGGRGTDGGTAGDSAAGGDAAGDAAAVLVPVTGIISENGTMVFTPIDGATVSVVDAMPANVTVTAPDGSYALMVPEGATVYIRAAFGGFGTMQQGVVPGAAGGNVDLELIPQVAIDFVSMQLGIVLDPTRGEAIVTFDTTSTAGGFGATLSAAHEPAFTFDPGGFAVTSDTTVPGGENRLLYANVVAGTTTVTPLPPAGFVCTFVEPIVDWRIDPGIITEVDTDCQ